MGNVYDDNQQLIVYNGVSNTLSTSTGEMTLTAGVWTIWASQAYQIHVQRATGQTLATNPQIWPANYETAPISVPLTSTWYVLHRANVAEYSTAGMIYANRISPAKR
jgi:hypothetical protein